MAQRFCKVSGCSARSIVGSGYCHRHGQQAARAYWAARDKREQDRLTDSRRPSASRRGYTNKWAIYSAARLRRHPRCARCSKPATVTDHIKPVRFFPGLFWDKSNHQSLCRACNRRKVAEDARQYGAGQQGGAYPCAV